MQEFIDFLNANRTVFLATENGDQPLVRPFQFLFAQNGKLYFCTSNTKDVYKQLTRNPYVEICALSQDNVWVRIRGAVTFCPEHRLKEKILVENPTIRSIFKSADNPAFEVFCLEHGEAVRTDLSGDPPVTVAF